jgi:hypothetical protein
MHQAMIHQLSDVVRNTDASMLPVTIAQARALHRAASLALRREQRQAATELRALGASYYDAQAWQLAAEGLMELASPDVRRTSRLIDQALARAAELRG